jgi:hypothetical protein
MYDNGAMDGACENNVSGGSCDPCLASHTCPYSYVTNAPVSPDPYGIVEPYFQIATNYGYANWMFQTNQGPSFEAHQFLFAGTSAPDAYLDPSQNCGSAHPCWQWFASELLPPGTQQKYGCIAVQGAVVLEEDPNSNESAGYQPSGFPFPDNPGWPCYEHPTMSDLLDANSVNWRFYGYSKSQGELWNAPDAIAHICQTSGVNGTCTGPDWPGQTGYNGKIVLDPTQVVRDLGVTSVSCNLPPVSWVIPDGSWSDHPGTPGEDGGPSWVAAIVNAVGGYDNSGNKLPLQCNYWNNTVVLVTWDDWGGFYDDVLPWNCTSTGKCTGYSYGFGQQYVYGFRVPLLVVSAWTPPYVSGSSAQPALPYVHDFGSILNFTEWALGQNQQPLYLTQPGYGIGPINYPYADYLAPDAPASDNKATKYSLSDFFASFSAPPLSFTQIIGAKYPTSCFTSATNAKACFPGFPSDPDNDAIDP